jgi:hypothetical protein
MSLTVLYRGPLSSCNYGCVYCPFAKRREDGEAHATDAKALERFVTWGEKFDGVLSVFLTPWGEALLYQRYQAAIVRLSKCAHVRKVAIQTNLSARLDFLESVDPAKVGVWATYHPDWVSERRFLSQCERLLERGVSFSVGVVGFPRFRSALDSIRAKLPSHVYVWVNAVKSTDPGYTDDDIAHFTRVDPLFPINNTRHVSFGRQCAGGSTVIAVDGEGTARSCHFVPTPIGNIYEAGFQKALRSRLCAAATCGCHIGYVHLEFLQLRSVFGEGILERNPRGPVWAAQGGAVRVS